MADDEIKVLRAAGEILTEYRQYSEAEGVVVSLAGHGPSVDCSVESLSVGVMWNGQVWTGNSTCIRSAVGIARAKIADEKERLAKEAEKRAKARARTEIDRAHEAMT